MVNRHGVDSSATRHCVIDLGRFTRESIDEKRERLDVESLEDGVRKGLRLIFEDQGPGIKDIDMAMRDGFTSGSGMGLGLGGAKRLSNEFHIYSVIGQGTRVVIARWKGST